MVCLDPLAWLRAGLMVNPGEFVLGQPGTGKSTLVKRQLTGAVATGTRVLVLGDTKPDYSMLVEHLGGQVIRVGRGMDRINPLDAGPLGAALRQMSGPDAQALRWEVRSRRLSLLMALCTLIRGAPITNAEEVILGRAIDLLDDRLTSAQPAVTDVLAVIEQGPDTLRAAARTDTPAGFRDRVADLVFTLDLLCTGSLAGVFDGQTSRPVDLDAPAVSVDISRVGAAGDHLLTAAMLCTWAHGYAMVDAAAALAEQHLAPRRSYLAVMDELWRALRGAPGLVEYADSLTRLNRAKGMGTIMITHSLADLDALSSEEDRAKARGFVERCAITVMGGLPPRELARVCEITPLTGPEQELVTSWSAPDSWQPGAKHPGRGKYLIKTGERLGIPVELSLVGAEYDLVRHRPGHPGQSGVSPETAGTVPGSDSAAHPAVAPHGELIRRARPRRRDGSQTRPACRRPRARRRTSGVRPPRRGTGAPGHQVTPRKAPSEPESRRPRSASLWRTRLLRPGRRLSGPPPLPAVPTERGSTISTEPEVGGDDIADVCMPQHRAQGTPGPSGTRPGHPQLGDRRDVGVNDTQQGHEESLTYHHTLYERGQHWFSAEYDGDEIAHAHVIERPGPGGPHAEIRKLWTNPHERGRGIGSRLLDQVSALRARLRRRPGPQPGRSRPQSRHRQRPADDHHAVGRIPGRHRAAPAWWTRPGKSRTGQASPPQQTQARARGSQTGTPRFLPGDACRRCRQAAGSSSGSRSAGSGATGSTSTTRRPARAATCSPVAPTKTPTPGRRGPS